MKRKILKSG